MTPWQLKAFVQGVISPLPAHDRLNRLLQRHVTGHAGVSETMFETKVAQCRRDLAGYRASHGPHALPQVALELGTGRAPIVPIGLALAGVRSVLTVDVRRLLEPADIEATIELYARRVRTGTREPLPTDLAPERAAVLLGDPPPPGACGPIERLAGLGITVLTGELPALGLPDRSVNLFVSNNTLEHIGSTALQQLMIEMGRLAAPGAVMSHFVDMSDHYAHFDRRISQFNYMRYPCRTWRLANNRLHYQNRLRACDYHCLIRAAGFTLASDDRERGSARELSRIALAPRFRGYDHDDLLTLRSWITATAPRTP